MVKFTKQKQSKGMNKMIVEDKKIEKACSFYVSDYHLEMILMPYINSKIDNNEEIEIATEKDLRDSVKTLISKVNISNENKEKIMNLGWNKDEKKSIKENSNIIVIGTEDYINKVNNQIESSNFEKVNIVNCYNFDDVKNDINKIVDSHDNSLNTIGFNNIS